MSDNRAFWKALHSLTHPLSILTILVLLFNDHWLRHNYPSWLTGKLGDFTWLLFAPFITAMLIALIIPKDRPYQTKLVGLLSIGFIGIWFATAKTIPFVHWLTTETLYNIVGYRGTLRLDITDLLTLPALLFSWHIWRQSPETNINLKPIGYVAFGLGILTTMATSYPEPPPDTTIQRICELSDGSLYTTYGNIYTIAFSSDDGRRWVEQERSLALTRCSSIGNTMAVNPNNSDIRYRWIRGRYVEQSTNAGETWVRINNLPELQQDVRVYFNHQSTRGSDFDPAPYYQPSPVSGLVHSETGNLILAMSSDGVLVITSDGVSQWSDVGQNQLADLQNDNSEFYILSLHQYLLPTLWCLILVTVVVLIKATSLSKNVFRHFWVSIGWISWIWLVLEAHDSISGGAGFGLSIFPWGMIALLSLILIAIPMMLWAIYYLLKHYIGALLPIFITSILASIAYLLPLLLWTQGTIPRYYMASIFSLLLVGCVLWACYQQFKDKLPEKYVPEKAKRKQKEA